MDQNRPALRYAKAVLNLAIEKKAAETVEGDMRHIAATIDQNSELQNLLKNPVIPAVLKKEVLQHIFTASQHLIKDLIRVLTDNKRIALLREVAHTYTMLYKKQRGEATAYVTTAIPLTPDLEAKIEAAVTKSISNNITVKNKIDENILGGFILSVGDLQYDASIAGNLNSIKKEFTNSL